MLVRVFVYLVEKKRRVISAESLNVPPVLLRVTSSKTNLDVEDCPMSLLILNEASS